MSMVPAALRILCAVATLGIIGCASFERQRVFSVDLECDWEAAAIPISVRLTERERRYSIHEDAASAVIHTPDLSDQANGLIRKKRIAGATYVARAVIRHEYPIPSGFSGPVPHDIALYLDEATPKNLICSIPRVTTRTAYNFDFAIVGKEIVFVVARAFGWSAVPVEVWIWNSSTRQWKDRFLLDVVEGWWSSSVSTAIAANGRDIFAAVSKTSKDFYECKMYRIRGNEGSSWIVPGEAGSFLALQTFGKGYVLAAAGKGRILCVVSADGDERIDVLDIGLPTLRELCDLSVERDVVTFLFETDDQARRASYRVVVADSM